MERGGRSWGTGRGGFISSLLDMQVHLEIKQKSVLENLQNKDAFYHLNKCSEFKHTLSALIKSISVFSLFLISLTVHILSR